MWGPRRQIELHRMPLAGAGSSHVARVGVDLFPIFAAAALRANGYPPLLLDFEAEHDTDHVIAIFRENGCGGPVDKSNYTGCRWREPVHRTLRELALTYFLSSPQPRCAPTDI